MGDTGAVEALLVVEAAHLLLSEGLRRGETDQRSPYPSATWFRGPQQLSRRSDIETAGSRWPSTRQTN